MLSIHVYVSLSKHAVCDNICLPNISGLAALVLSNKISGCCPISCLARSRAPTQLRGFISGSAYIVIRISAPKKNDEVKVLYVEISEVNVGRVQQAKKYSLIALAFRFLHRHCLHCRCTDCRAGSYRDGFTQVCKHYLRRGREQYVCRFDVAVDDIHVVQKNSAFKQTVDNTKDFANISFSDQDRHFRILFNPS